MLTRYDEFPVHQAPRPFSDIPYTDFAWDDGYFFGLYSAEEEVFFFSGMRVNPNTDVIGGYPGIADGRQYYGAFQPPLADQRGHHDRSAGLRLREAAL